MERVPIGHSPKTGQNCKCADGRQRHPPVWPAGTRAAAFVSGRGYWEPSDCCRRKKQEVR